MPAVLVLSVEPLFLGPHNVDISLWCVVLLRAVYLINDRSRLGEVGECGTESASPVF